MYVFVCLTFVFTCMPVSVCMHVQVSVCVLHTLQSF